MTGAAHTYWDQQASTFDEEPDHGLRDPVVRAAWRKLLTAWVPTPKRAVLDIGCGTGSLSVLLAELGHTVTGIDFAPAMIAAARAKAQAAGQTIRFQVMDAGEPDFSTERFDVVFCRHLLWALPDRTQVLQRWVGLLKPGGQLVLIEGYWHTGGGLHAEALVASLPTQLIQVTVQPLHDDPTLWGKPITDERYVVLAQLES